MLFTSIEMLPPLDEPRPLPAPSNLALILPDEVALIVKLQVLDLEQIELAGDSMAEQLASLGDELAILESTIQAG